MMSSSPSRRTNASVARRRWLMAFLASPSICAKLSELPSGTNTGSYPKPWSPCGSRAILPSTRPRTVYSRPPHISAITVLKCAARSLCPFILSSSRRILALSSWPAPGAYLAECTPGAPPRASTSRPVSSAKQSQPYTEAT